MTQHFVEQNSKSFTEEKASQGTSVQLGLQAAIQGESTNFVPIFAHRYGKLNWHWGGEYMGTAGTASLSYCLSSIDCLTVIIG
jgi:hypothetical protein